MNSYSIISMYTIRHTTIDVYTVCNKNYYGHCNIIAIHKGDWCMWNMIVAYVALAYSVSSMVLILLCDMTMASNAW